MPKVSPIDSQNPSGKSKVNCLPSTEEKTSGDSKENGKRYSGPSASLVTIGLQVMVSLAEGARSPHDAAYSVRLLPSEDRLHHHAWCGVHCLNFSAMANNNHVPGAIRIGCRHGAI
jgi:hypothetical protein